MSTRFVCDASGQPEPFPHFWEYCVGSGRAALALRADWQAQLKQCREDLGFQHVRFHGLLDDDMGTLNEQKEKSIYSFHNVDKIYDFLLSIGMRPAVELSFMPKALASGDETVFHYQANVTPPQDYDAWATLVSKLARHCIERYGANEVSSWPIEVWNEPNIPSFWTGSQQDYFRLYETTWKALKHVHEELRVGGPVTAKQEWIPEFLAYCSNASVPPDFISTHTYPTDALGSPDDDTRKTLAKGHLGILREQAEDVRKQAGQRPLYYTEWCTSSNPRDELHDEPYAAAYIVHTMMSLGTLVDAYSYWTFSDIFEENFFPAKPFQGGFGLMTIAGIPKPSYRAFELLHRLGNERMPVKGEHETVKVWAVRDANKFTLVIVNLALPEHPIEVEKVDLEIFGLSTVAAAQAFRIDHTHANAKGKWKLQGEPQYPTPDEVAAMIEASMLHAEPVSLRQDKNALRFGITVQPQSVTAVELQFAAPQGMRESKASPAPHHFETDDEKLLDQLQESAFGYFTEHTNPKTGLIADNSKRGSPASISVTGFALSCYPIAVERGWIDRKQAAETAAKTLRFFAQSRQGDDAQATGHKGFYYHFLDMRSGKRANDCELSTIDTGMLLAGMMLAAQYFDRKDETEQEIRTLAQKLFERVDWGWAMDPKKGEVHQAWLPDHGFKKPDWRGYSEALLMYVIGAASPTHPLPPSAREKDTETFAWRHNVGLDWVHAAPLFIHLFPQAWLDLRGLDDGHISRKDDLDYFTNTQRAIFVQRVYAFLNPHAYLGYGKDVWGLSACPGPDGERTLRDGRKQKCLGYEARGVPHGPDDGTLVPWAAAACMAYEPKVALEGLRTLLRAYPRVLRNGRFAGAFNPSLPGDGPEGWVAPACAGLDQGLIVMMIENARTGFVWQLTRTSPTFREGLRRLGFHGGWLEGA